MNSTTEQGYLVLADISGYTSYLADVELDHAHEILTELLETIVGGFKPLLTVVKLEGDAVLAHAPAGRILNCETVLELIELTYAAFHERVMNSLRHTTCQCRACQCMPDLDLKFFLHYGQYMTQHVAGIDDLVGSDVNLVHRLMKNHITERTGWKAYAMLTAPGIQHLQTRPAGLHEQTEAYEHLGETRTYSYDLRSRYEQLMQARSVVVTLQEAFVVLVQDYPVPAPVLWEWLNDPRKRSQYTAEPGLEFRSILLPGGRRGIGAQTHCMHGQDAAMKEVVLDWKPFTYYTVEQDAGRLGAITSTFRLEAIDGGERTKLTLLIKGRIIPGFLNRPLIQLIYGRYFMPTVMKKLALSLAEAGQDGA